MQNVANPHCGSGVNLECMRKEKNMRMEFGTVRRNSYGWKVDRFKERLLERKTLREDREKVKRLRLQWEKEVYYCKFEAAKEIWRELFKLGYSATLEDTISIYWENGRRA